MDKWEYKIISYGRDNDKNMKYMNDLGEKGWEAFHMHYYGYLTVYYKRKIE